MSDEEGDAAEEAHAADADAEEEEEEEASGESASESGEDAKEASSDGDEEASDDDDDDDDDEDDDEDEDAGADGARTAKARLCAWRLRVSRALTRVVPRAACWPARDVGRAGAHVRCATRGRAGVRRAAASLRLTPADDAPRCARQAATEVFVGGLAVEATEEDLHATLSVAGDIAEVRALACAAFVRGAAR